ncbi:MAG: hypothetical protein HeimC3_36200 [Candidatus Heimdallarchaeota archaeon LC_3]|nr:MAG: hypothetical protein HeimC3_36200 [Candidatus Heimdallarchaeota archaeon LC_3]
MIRNLGEDIMNDKLVDALSKSFHGEWTHIDPKRALKGLTSENARKKPKGFDHSCWELLYHIVTWQKTLLKNIKGQEIDWNKIEQEDNWPNEEILKNDENFSELVETFYSGINESKELIKNVDLLNEKEISIGPKELSIIKLTIVLLQHTSYHLGQIVSLRKFLGDWPLNH